MLDIKLLLLVILHNALCAYCESFTDQGLTFIPGAIPQSVTVLDLSRNSYTAVKTGWFCGYFYLETLTMSDNQISYIAPDAFNSSNTIKSILFVNNLLTAIPDLRSLSGTLQRIVLRKNPIQNSPNDTAFLSGFTQLWNVNVGESKWTSMEPIKSMAPQKLNLFNANWANLSNIGTLQNLVRCSWLELSYNKFILPSLNNDTFVGMIKLKHLSLAGIGLKYFPSVMLQPVKKILDYLKLSDNVITNISEDQLEGFNLLTNLKLRSNKLTSVPNLYPLKLTLKFLDLADNYIQYVPEKVFDGFNQLLELNIENNLYLDYTPDFGNATENIQTMFLKNTGLSYVDRNFLAAFKNLKKIAPVNDKVYFGDLFNFTVLNNTLEVFDSDSAKVGTVHRTFLEQMQQLKVLSLVDSEIQCMEEPPADRNLVIEITNIRIYCGCCWKWFKESEMMSELGSTVISGEPGGDSVIGPCSLGPTHLKHFKTWGEITIDDLLHDCGAKTTSSSLTSPTSVSHISGTPTTTSASVIDKLQWTTHMVQETVDPLSIKATISSATIVGTSLELKYKQTEQDVTTNQVPLVSRYSGKKENVDTKSIGFLKWNVWLPWSQCSVSFCSGDQKRLRLTNANPSVYHIGIHYKKKHEIGFESSVRNCTLKNCVRSFNVGSWSNWSTCTTSCGTGTRTRTRGCSKEAVENGGKHKTLCYKEHEICLFMECNDRQKSQKTALSLYPTWSDADYRASAIGLGTFSCMIICGLAVIVILVDLITICKTYKIKYKKD